MDVSYNPAKNARNITEHRFQALGKIYGRLHMLVFTPRNDVIHVISLRKANAREVSHYDQDK